MSSLMHGTYQQHIKPASPAEPATTQTFWPSPPTTEHLPTHLLRRRCTCAAHHSSGAGAGGGAISKKRSRKCIFPTRAIPRGAAAALSGRQKRREGIIKLDVFAAYLASPDRLLFDRHARARDLSMWRERHAELDHAKKADAAAGVTAKRSRTAAAGGSSSSSSSAAAAAVSVAPLGKRKRGRPPRKSTTTTSASASASSSSAPAARPVEFREAAGAPPPLLAALVTPTDPDTTKGAPHVTWNKGDALHIPANSPGYDLLSREELRTCRTLRLVPESYLKIKAILLGAREQRGAFKKRDAQKWCRIDVNKTGKLYDWFSALGWLLPI
ncbi:Transcriptional adapter ada2 [Geranomyces variabilis]|uniref:Transcriptional adapter ada2 n=1 Tax=Geranomyces variabilis TaxID=109894 RepID=A0AAD5TPB1_9FUNG|nr:Transcriptional adapter ada2 [Geranomyces variabilis]